MICVLGAGKWGSAIASSIKGNVLIYSRSVGTVESINASGLNPSSGVKFESNVMSFCNLQQILDKGLETVFISIPCGSFVEFFSVNKQYFSNVKNFVICSKGFVIIENEAVSLVSFLESVFGISKNYAVLSGPNFYNELYLRKKTVTTVASKSIDLLRLVDKLLSSEYLKIELTEDVDGVQVLGLCKNPIAIGSGILSSINASNNEVARFLTAVVAETTIIINHFGGKAETALLSCGIGDIYLSCSSSNSRNFRYGQMLGSVAIDNGTPVGGQGVEKSFETIEGIGSAKCISIISAKAGFELPIYDTLHNIIEKRSQAQKLFDLI